MISLQYLKEAFDYDPETGELFWKAVRPRHHFATDRAFLCHQTRDGGKVAGHPMKGGYLAVGVAGKPHLVHRIVYAIYHSIEPCDLPKILDHRDCDPSNNKISNLRPATSNENSCNTSLFRTSTTGYKGVGWKKQNKRWFAHIKFDGKKIHLGYFDTPEQARDARAVAANTYHGDFARAA